MMCTTSSRSLPSAFFCVSAFRSRSCEKSCSVSGTGARKLCSLCLPSPPRMSSGTIIVSTGSTINQSVPGTMRMCRQPVVFTSMHIPCSEKYFA
eukprot:1291077-Rhodomonas_salina.1